MSDQSKISTSQSGHTFQAPKSFIVPFVLLSLRDFNLHGYKIFQRLVDFGFSTIDQGNFYRMLRQLEKEDMVESVWVSSTTGPAKRLYSITDTGEQYLRTCVNSLEHYQSMLDRFFSMYTSMFILSSSSKDQNENKNI